MQEVNALSDKIHSASQEDLKDKKEELLKKFDKRRSTFVTELSAVRHLIIGMISPPNLI